MADKKQHINLVVIGHVDHGKSTTVGRILFDTGVVTQQELDKLKARASELGKAGFEFAFIMDKVKEEQERGVTIDLSYKEFQTQKYYITIIDAPGHKDFVKNMITGTSQADAALLIVSANPGEGVMAQTQVASFDDLKTPEKPINKPLRMPIQDVYTITGIGTVPVGRIETGVMKVNQQIIVMPSGKVGEVKSIEMHHEQMPTAEPGDNVGINLRGIGKEDMRRGDVIGPLDSPPPVVKEFTAKMVVLNHPTVITAGYCPVFHVHTAQVSCKIKEIKAKLDPRTGQPLPEKPDFLKTGDTAEVVIEPLQPLVIEKQSDNPKLSKFAIRDMGRTVAAGMCIDYVKRQ